MNLQVATPVEGLSWTLRIITLSQPKLDVCGSSMPRLQTCGGVASENITDPVELGMIDLLLTINALMDRG